MAGRRFALLANIIELLLTVIGDKLDCGCDYIRQLKGSIFVPTRICGNGLNLTIDYSQKKVIEYEHTYITPFIDLS